MITSNLLYLTEEGLSVIKNGSPEYNLVHKIKSLGHLDPNEVDKMIKTLAFKNRSIKLVNNKLVINEIPKNDFVSDLLKEIKLNNDKSKYDLKIINELIKRGFVKSKNVNSYKIMRGEKYFNENEGELSVLTIDHVQKGISDLYFKKYNFDTTGKIPQCGSLHPLLKMKDEFKRIFLEMGFHEMATNQYVENSFWNFDSLFQPQNHPSRDEHDTFFVSKPVSAKLVNDEYLNKVKNIHEKGYEMEWDVKESEKNILRTHTTAVTARYLYALNNNFTTDGNKSLQDLKDLKAGKRFEPVKLFSIDKVYRNETVDATHLAEFHQMEGVIAGYNLGLGDLMGIIKEFFNRLGISNIKFKPASNPYTEPSLEVFGYHEGLNKWIEMGNSGIFRPEMIEPMGYSDDITVLGWGLSVERPSMIRCGLNNIRELVGHKVDLSFIKNSDFVFFK
ncbi:SYFA [Hepatospora eriocheir]|uniref:phenylalanine--tRNA ligase n=1 Tax=Hepatospora eriocheir TaxID=1081669 RepID=A0A1X0QE62_9MICR|nr:SYFA [Hepatospora eriocheir]